MKNFVVLIMGHTGSGKSTVARKISEKLGLEIYHSAIVRKELGYTFDKNEAESDFFVLTSKKREPMDKAVYGEIAKLCRKSLINGKNVVLDAGYFFKWQREEFYNSVQDINPEVFIVRVECPEEEIIKRLAKRKEEFSKSPFNETPSMKAYESCKIATEDPKQDKFNKKPTIIYYNSHTGEISYDLTETNKNLNLLISALK